MHVNTEMYMSTCTHLVRQEVSKPIQRKDTEKSYSHINQPPLVSGFTLHSRGGGGAGGGVRGGAGGAQEGGVSLVSWIPLMWE